MSDTARCSGTRWIWTDLNGKPQKLHARDCPKASQCERARLFNEDAERAESLDAFQLQVHVDPGEHGTECPNFLPVTKN